MRVELFFKNEEVRDLYREAGVQTPGSAGFDLVCIEDVTFSSMGEFRLIELGVVIKVPAGHHSLLIPRSSTFAKFKILQANSVGLIDEDYCGAEDWWKMPSVFMGNKPVEIKRGTRLCQFLLQKTIPIDGFVEFVPSSTSRGGLGSTGV